jgi:hypothetical protein
MWLRPKVVVGALLTFLALAAVALLVHGPIAQDEGYHHFADSRTLLGVPHAWNVLSNLPFLFAGAYGLYEVAEEPWPWAGWERAGYTMFFLGVFLTAFGSGYYHLDPTTPRLFWDRLPMTLGFTSFFSLWVGERVSLLWGRRMLGPALAIGVISMLYWRYTELAGHGDLRLYGVVQFFPIVATPALFLLPSTRPHARYVGYLLGWYVLAKGLEGADAIISQATDGLFAGHAWKHVAAALGAGAVARRVRAFRSNERALT